MREPIPAAASAAGQDLGQGAALSADDSARHAHEATKSVADPQNAADRGGARSGPRTEWNLSPLPNRYAARRRAELENLGRFDRKKLETLGLDPEEIDRLERIWAEVGGDELRASQEDGTPPANAKQAHALQEEICVGLADVECDSLLYASGYVNRVFLPNVAEDTLAFEVGLRAGDEIIRVGEERIFSMFSMRDVLAAQSKIPPYIIVVRRNGTLLPISIEAGEGLGMPLGARPAEPLRE
ncbi:MAG: hypothetical protein JRG92_12935 [Deltaproteobacteria bacterium]|nr:hypothetical protein [Deltaproteobacteria bacterium]